MNLRSIDLNLLVILDALLEEAHVTRAARRIGLSQPAVSSALERCRNLFRDSLLERGRAGMRLTAKAESLRAPLKDLLAEVDRLVDPPATPLAELRRTVRLLMSDHPAPALGPVLERLRETAPGIDLIVRPWLGSAAVREALISGEADLSLAPFRESAPGIRRRHLLDEHYVVLMRRDHPARVGFDVDRWLAYPHVVVSGRGDAPSLLDKRLAELGRERRVGIVVPSFLMVPSLALKSDLIAMLPSRCLPEHAAGSFAIFEPPLPVEGFPLHLAWHVRRDGDIAIQHVAGLIEEVLTSLPGQ